jgi:N-acyl-D-amino-acid deacylase
MANVDVLIKGGMVIDGKLGKMRRADVTIDGDKISFVGDAAGTTGTLEIDATGKYVAPGFIDLTNHSDTHWRLFNDPGQESMLYQGITTILGGNCGSSLAPLVHGADIEGIGKWVNVSDININWQTTEEFIAELERYQFGVNFATLIGHGTLRRGVMRDGARTATDSEIEQMKLLLDRSMKAGAWGFSISLGSAHGKAASEREILELIGVVAGYDGLVKHHLRDEGAKILSSVSELLGHARKSGARICVSHFKAIGRRASEHAIEALSMISQARGEGTKLGYDVFPYTSTGSNLFMLLPQWAIEGDKQMILANLRDKEKHNAIIASLKEATLHYDRIIIATAIHDSFSVGKSIAEIAERAGKSPEEAMLDILLINGLGVTIFNEVIDPKSLEYFVARDYAAIATDGVGYGERRLLEKELPHPRSFGSCPRVFREFVKEKALLSWEEAVYKMTGLPAEVLGLKDRGILEKGKVADVVVFDPETITDVADYTDPHRFSVGMDWVLVGGVPAIRNGKTTGDLRGKVLKKR